MGAGAVCGLCVCTQQDQAGGALLRVGVLFGFACPAMGVVCCSSSCEGINLSLLVLT